MGAISPRGVRVLNEHIVRQARVSHDEIEQVTARERKELDRRDRLYRGDRADPEIGGPNDFDRRRLPRYGLDDEGGGCRLADATTEKRRGHGPCDVVIGTVVEPVPVTGLAPNFSPMPRIAPPPFGRDMEDPGARPSSGVRETSAGGPTMSTPAARLPRPRPRAQPTHDAVTMHASLRDDPL